MQKHLEGKKQTNGGGRLKIKSKPINAKNFMEFFENQCGVKFVDSSTGESVLNLINKRETIKSSKRVCGSCKYGAKGDGVAVHLDDIVCVNYNSHNVADFVFADSSCTQWESSGGI